MSMFRKSLILLNLQNFSRRFPEDQGGELLSSTIMKDSLRCGKAGESRLARLLSLYYHEVLRGFVTCGNVSW